MRDVDIWHHIYLYVIMRTTLATDDDILAAAKHFHAYGAWTQIT